MKKIMIFIFNIILISTRVLLISAEYSYNTADEWKNEYSKCGGSEQSPIDVYIDVTKPDEVEYSDSEIKFEYSLTTVPQKTILKNDGHTLKLLFEWANDEEHIPYVHGGPLEHKYILHSFQFRWSFDVNSGSEHRRGGKRYPMEMQVVHYSNEFESYEEAEDSKNGLMIHSLFFEIGSEFKFLTKINKNIPKVLDPGAETEIKSFAMKDYFKVDEFVKHIVYHGSLSHPPCYESVVWIISDTIIPATENQIKAFQNLNLYNDDNHNNRPLQERNDRKFIFSE